MILLFFVVYVWADFHVGSQVIASIAIIGSWEYCGHFFLMINLVSLKLLFQDNKNYLLYKLMGSENHIQLVVVNELLGNISSKCVPSSSLWNTPSVLLVGVWPQQVTHWSFVWYFLNSEKVSWMKIRTNLSSCRTCSSVSMAGESPPWRQNNLLSTVAEMGR